MVLERKNIFQNKDLDKMTSKVAEALYDGIEKYWEQDVKINLTAINDFKSVREDHLIEGVDFFSSQIKVESHKPIAIRLSSTFINSFLSCTLGENHTEFNLIRLTKLETNILNNFCEFLFKKINSALIPVEKAKITEVSTLNVNFLFTVKNRTHPSGFVSLSIPQDRVEFVPFIKKENFFDEDFLDTKMNVRVKAGSTKITYEELKTLSCDDIVILEESNISKLILISGDTEKKFNVKTSSSLVYNINKEAENLENENQVNNEVTMEKSLWDDIQIELSAEFERVKMTISELKQISQGQIVDLGSVFDNEIALYVENKKIASGELIVINDRYAVKLNKVLHSSQVKTQNQQTVQPKPNPSAPIPAKVNPSARPAQAHPAPQARPAAAPQARPAAAPQARPAAPVRPAQAHPAQQARPAAPVRPAQARPAAPVRPTTAPQAKAQGDKEEFDYSDFEK